MTARYVDGANGDDSWDGLAPNFVTGTNGPKKTLTSAEGTVAAGDIVNIRPGVYRESITLLASGSAGNAIEYRGDYAGAIWPGGGVVRITGSDNDIVGTRLNVIVGGGRSFRSFTNLHISMATNSLITTSGSAAANWIIDKCYFMSYVSQSIIFHNSGAAGQNWIIRNCYFLPHISTAAIAFSISSSNNNHLIENCIFISGVRGIQTTQVGGITVRNCTFIGCANGVRVVTVLPGGQTINVYNSIFINSSATALQATTTAEFVEDYNTFSANVADRTNVNTGANSLTYPPTFDARWFFQLVNAAAANQLVNPYDMASWSPLINVAGFSPPATDMRGTGTVGGVKDLGPLEYDPSLKITGSAGGSGVSRSRTQ